MPQKQIKFGIGFNTDLSGLKQIEAELTRIAQLPTNKLVDEKEIIKVEKAQKAARELKDLLNSSYNFKLNTLDISKFSEGLKNSGKTLHDYQLQLSRAGDIGKDAFRHLATEIATSNTELKQSKSLLDSMGQTFINTIKWSIASSAINRVTGSIQKAYSFSKQLDESLNDIRIVTGKSADEMDKFAVRANKAAAALGKTTRDYTTASLLFYQQGLNDRDVQARTNVTLKAANVTGQSTAEVSEQLTAIWNGYKVSAQEAETYIDKVAAVAASTASDLEELSEGMSKVAAAANNMGVDIDQLNAQLSTIISVTRQDAGVAGTALKTIYARMTDIESGLDTETTLGNYTAEMAKFGIQVLDAKGGLRDVGDVMDEIGGKWTSFTREQQVALAQAMAGTRQYNNLMALFGNWDMYTKSLETSREAMGTLQNQQDIYMESLEGHLNQLTASQEKLYNSLFDSEGFKTLLDVTTNIVDKIGDFVSGIGGAVPAISMIVGLLLQLFNKQIGNEIANMIINVQNGRANLETAAEKINILKETAFSAEQGLNQMTKTITELGIEIAKLTKQKLITPEERADLEARIRQLNELADVYSKVRETRKQAAEYLTQNVTGDQHKETSNNIYKQFNQIENELDQQNSWAEAVKKEFKESNGEIEIFLDNLPKLRSGLDETQKTAFNESNTGKFINQLSDVTQSYDKLALATRDYGSTTKKTYADFMEQLQSSDHSITNNIANIRKYDAETADILAAEWEDAFAKIAEITKDGGNITEKQSVQIRAIMQNFAKSIDDGSEKSKIALKALEEALGQVGKKAEEEGEKVKKSFTLSEAQIRDTAQKITKYIGIANSMLAAGSSIKNLITTWGDGAASAEDKTKSLISTITMLATTVVVPIIKSTAALMKSEGLKVGAAMWASLGPYAAIGIVIAAVYSFIRAIGSVINLYKEQSKVVEKANELLKKQKEIYDGVAESYNKLKDSIQDYRDAQTAIEKLTVGTQEWRDAIADANEKVMNLMQAYPALAAAVRTNIVDGQTVMSFDQDALNSIQNARLQEMSSAQVGMYAAQTELRNAVNLLTAYNLNKTNNYGQGGDAYASTLLKGMFAPFGVFRGFESGVNSIKSGDVWAGIGKILAGPIGIFFAAAEDQVKAQQLATESTQKALEKIAEDYLNNGEVAFTRIESTLEGFDKSLVTSLTSNTEALRENTKLIATNLRANAMTNVAMAHSYLIGQNNSDYTSSLAQSAIDNIVARLMLNSRNDIEAAVSQLSKEELYSEYAKSLGYAYDQSSGKMRAWNTETRSYDYKDIDFDTARENVIINRELAKAAEQVNIKLINAVANGYNNSKVRDALMSLANQDKSSIIWTNLTQKEFGELQNSLNGLSEEFIKELTGQTKSDFEILTKSLEDNYNLAWNDALKYVEEDRQSNFETIFANNLEITADERTAFAKIYGKLSDSAIKGFNQFIEESSGQTEELVHTLISTDFTDVGAFEQFSYKIKELGINITDNFDIISSIFNEVALLQDNIGSFDVTKFNAFFEGLWSIVKGIKGFGDTISKEKYDEYIKKYPSLADFFVLDENEQYAYTGQTAGELWKVVAETRRTENQLKIDQTTASSIRYKGSTKYEQDKAAWEAQNSLRDASQIGVLLTYKAKGYKNGLHGTGKEINNYENLDDNDIIAFEENGWRKFVEDLDEIRAKDPSFGDGEEWWSDVHDNNGMYKRNYIAMRDAIKAENEKISKQSETKTYEDSANYTNTMLQYRQDTAKERSRNLLQEVQTQLGNIGNLTDLESAYTSFKDTRSYRELTEKDKEEFEQAYQKRHKYLEDAEFLRGDPQRRNTNLQERYELERTNLEAKISSLQSKADIAAGQAQLDILKQEADLTEKIYENRKNTLDTITEENRINKETLQAFTRNSFYGDLLQGVVDEKGNLKANLTYDEVVNSITDRFNQRYSGTTAEGAQGDFNTLLTLIKDIFTGEEKYISAEGEMYSSYSDYVQSRLEEFNGRLTQINSVTDNIKDFDEFARKLAKDNYYAIAQTYYADAQVAEMRLTELYEARQKIAESDIAGKEKIAALETNTQQIQQETLALQESLTQAEETRLTLAEKITEQYESQSKYYDMMRQTLLHQINMAKLLYGDSNYSEQVKYYSELYDKTSKMLEVSAKQVATTQAAYEALKNSDSDAAKKAYEDYIQAQKQYLDSIEDTLEAAQEKFENVILGAFEVFANNLAGGRFADALSQYNWQQEFNQENMTGMRRELNISNVGIAYQRAINEYAGDTSAQARLTALYREQVSLLRDKEYLNRNDITLAEKRLALEKARIDLENARSDTSTMRLVRGAGGEYSYQYVANEDNILSKIEALNKAELDYADSMNEAVKSGLDMYQTIMDLWHEFAQASTDEERNQILGRIKDVFAAMGEAFKGLDISNAPQELINFITALRNGDTDEGLDSLMETAQKLASEFSTIQKTLGDKSDESSETLISSLNDGVLMTENMASALEDQVGALDELIAKSSEYANNLAVAKDNALMASEALIASAAALNGIDLNGFSVSANPMRSLSGIVYSMSNIGALHSATEGANAVENTQNNSNNTEVNGQQIVQYISAQFPGVTTVSQIIEALEKIGTESVQENG